MKKSYLFKFFVFAVIAAFVTITSCKDYEDDISRIDTELGALKADMVKKSDLTTLETALKGQITALQNELNDLKGKVITQDKLDAAMALVVKLETFNAFKTTVEADIVKLKADVAKAATKEELAAIDAALKSQINGVKNDLAAHIANFEALKTIVNGHSTAIAGLETQLASQLALINANKAKIAAVDADLQAKYNELKGLIQQNANDIAALDNKVEEYKEYLEGKIADLKTELTGMIINVYQSLDHRVYTLTYIPDYTSLDGTPQIIVRGITEWNYHKPAGVNPDSYAPNFDSDWNENWAVKKTGAIYKGITILNYRVSPSNVQLSDFEVTALLHKTSLLRDADPNFKTKSAPIVLAGQATLANGVLSVPVAVDESSYDLTSGKWSTENGTQRGPNVSVALQVKNINVEMGNEEDRYVTSTEYVKANFDLSEGRIALNEKSKKPDGTMLPVGIEYTEIAGSDYASDISLWNGKSQSGNMTDVLNHTINLNDYIYGVFKDYTAAWPKMNASGFNTHTFKFRRVYLESEGVNQSNDYVTLNETTGVIGVKPAGNSVNQAAVNRTPIVEVTALVNGKVHAVGYIKIIVTDQFDKNPVKFEFTLEDYVLGCNSTYELTDVDIDAIDFDQVFNHPRIQLGKDAFFQEYKQGNLTATQVIKVSGPATATVGIDNTKHVWFQYAINPQTQSVNLYNYLEGNIRNDAPAGTYKVKTILKSNGFRPDVEITWNFKVVLPTNLKLTPNPVFLSNGIYKVEPTVYFQTPTPKTSTPYEGLLQNAFLHNNNNLDLGAVAGDQQCSGYLTPYFVFTRVPDGFRIYKNPQSPQTETGVFEVRRGGNGSGGELAATIYYFQTGDPNPKNFFTNKGFYIKLNDNAQGSPSSQVGNYAPLSQAAKDLVAAGWVEVQPRGYINGQSLNWVNLYEPFKVVFTYPLQFNFADKYEVWDQGTGAKQRVSIDLIREPAGLSWENNSVIKDFLGNDIVFSTDNGSGVNDGNNHRKLVDHYEIAHSTYNLGGFGNITWVPTINWTLSGSDVTTNLPGGQLPFGMTLKVDTGLSTGSNPNFRELVLRWENASGASTQNPFEVYLPVSIAHKWGTLTGKVTIVVNPGTGN